MGQVSGIQSVERLEPVFDPAALADKREAPALGQLQIRIREAGADEDVSPQ